MPWWPAWLDTHTSFGRYPMGEVRDYSTIHRFERCVSHVRTQHCCTGMMLVKQYSSSSTTIQETRTHARSMTTTHEALKIGEHRERLPDSTALASLEGTEGRLVTATATAPAAPPAAPPPSRSRPPPLLLPLLRRLTPEPPMFRAAEEFDERRPSLLARAADGCMTLKYRSSVEAGN